MRRTILALVILLMTAPLVAADTIYLRDGRTVRGTVLGFIGGRFAVRVSDGTLPTSGTRPQARTAGEVGEVRFFRPRDVERIEIDGRSLEEARFQTRTVEVALGPNWIDSGADLRRGERVSVRAEGTIVAGRTRITPDGLRSSDPTAPLPRSAEGVLIGAIGNDPNTPIIEIGLSREFIADRDGRLYLTSNRGSFADARGAFLVQIRTERDFSPRRTGDTAAGARSDDETDFDPFGTADRRTEPAPTRPRATAGQDDRFGDRVRPSRELTINVPGTSRGTDTGVDLITGDQVTIEATGEIVAGRRAGNVPPEGGRVGFGAMIGSYPLPNAGVGALIGFIRLSDGQVNGPFLVGRQLTFNSPVDGRLILLVNDDNYNDNSGSFNVRIRY